MIKRAAGMNHYANRIRNIDKISATVFCPECGADEDWEQVIFCEKNRETDKNG